MYFNLENSPRLFSLFIKKSHCCGWQHTQLGITYYSHEKCSLWDFRCAQNQSGNGGRSRGTWSGTIKLWTVREIVITEHQMTQHCQEFWRQQFRDELQKGLKYYSFIVPLMSLSHNWSRSYTFPWVQSTFSGISRCPVTLPGSFPVIPLPQMLHMAFLGILAASVNGLIQ